MDEKSLILLITVEMMQILTILEVTLKFQQYNEIMYTVINILV
jgi:hypothetical protein